MKQPETLTESQRQEHFAQVINHMTSRFNIVDRFTAKNGTVFLTFGKMTYKDKHIANIEWKLRQINKVYIMQDQSGAYFFRVHFLQRNKTMSPVEVVNELRQNMIKENVYLARTKKNQKKQTAAEGQISFI